MNVLAVTGVLLNAVIALIIYFCQGGADGMTSLPEMVGIMSGAVTNTPGSARHSRQCSRYMRTPAPYRKTCRWATQPPIRSA